MYAQLDLKFKGGIDANIVKTDIAKLIGHNAITPAIALANSPLINVPGILNSVIASEQVLNQATVVYFIEGSDTIKVHIMVKSLVHAKKQCIRITRQIPRSIGVLSEATATILVDVKGSDEAVIAGVRQSLLKQLWESTFQKFLSKFAPAGVTFAMASLLLQGTPSYLTAVIGATASVIGALVEGLVSVSSAGQWKWKDLS